MFKQKQKIGALWRLCGEISQGSGSPAGPLD